MSIFFSKNNQFEDNFSIRGFKIKQNFHLCFDALFVVISYPLLGVVSIRQLSKFIIFLRPFWIRNYSANGRTIVNKRSYFFWSTTSVFSEQMTEPIPAAGQLSSVSVVHAIRLKLKPYGVTDKLILDLSAPMLIKASMIPLELRKSLLKAGAG